MNRLVAFLCLALAVALLAACGGTSSPDESTGGSGTDAADYNDGNSFDDPEAGDVPPPGGDSPELHRDSDGDGSVDAYDDSPNGEDGCSDPSSAWDAAAGESPPPLEQDAGPLGC